MRPFNTLSHHPVLEEIVSILSSKTQNDDRSFFYVEAAYFMAKMASTMRATIHTKDRGAIPVNVYALCLATSGFGKGHSVNIIEDALMSGFRKRFIETTLAEVAGSHMLATANKISAFKGTDQKDELETLEKEYRQAGPYPYTFDSATVPAIKQLREKLLRSNIGAINLQIDEVGSNLLASAEILNTFLELYDVGKTKAKLTKNTTDNSRGQEIDGATPANMLLFGTPAKLLDGSNTEDTFFEFLETGYSRRFLFAWGDYSSSAKQLSAAEIYARLIDTGFKDSVKEIRARFTGLANAANHEWSIDLPDNVAIELIEYKIACEREADKLSDHREMEKAEMKHRYFKALKLAGVYAFVDSSPVITMDHLYNAIHLVQQSGQAFKKLFTREKPYAKLARYIADYDGEVTHSDLTEELPFYKSGNAARNEIMTLACAWGFKNNIMIRKTFVDGIEFFSGKSLKETNLGAVHFSASQQLADNYEPMVQPFEDLYKLTSAPGFHWANHNFENNYRLGANVEKGFDLVVLDIDGTMSLNRAQEMLQDYTFMTHTTKRHGQDGKDRFRLIMPIKYRLELERDDYKAFMDNLMAWLPFESDEGANQRERKWLTNPNGLHHYNMSGELLDPIRFIPKTSKNETHQAAMNSLRDLSSLERWFAEKMVMGNRNNQMIKFALALFDDGMTYPEIESHVLAFNEKLSDGLTKTELESTVLRTIAQRTARREP